MMVKMPNYSQEKDDSAMSTISKNRGFWATVSPILAIALCLYSTNITIAQQSPIDIKPRPRLIPQSATPPRTGVQSSGNQILLNGHTLSGAWLQRRSGTNKVTTNISDGALRQFIGIDLLNSSNPTRQPPL